MLDAIPDYQQTAGDVVPGDTETSGGASLDSGIVPDLVLQHGEETYRMNRRKRGKLVLICNTKFRAELKLADRKGTDKDIGAIKRVFHGILQFEVVEFYERKTYEMLRDVEEAAKASDNGDCDCFVVFVLTHGSDSGKVFGTEGEILISQLIEPLKNNPLLVGKPKMVFVQACRGKRHDPGIMKSVPDHGEESDHGEGGSSQHVMIPVEADFLYVYSTADGYVSFQNPTTGSWFVQTLCSELETNWQRLEMMQMLTRVCRVLAYTFASRTPSTPATHNLKQISSVTTTLTKAIRFHQP